MLDAKQLEILIEIAEENTLECYSEHITKYGPKNKQGGKYYRLTEVYEDELTFLREIKEQEGLDSNAKPTGADAAG